MNIPAKYSWWVLCAIGVTGCAPLPTKSPSHPEISQPKLQQTFTSVAHDPAFNPLASPSLAWWRNFNDTQLNSLVSMALRDNPTLATAQTRIDQARQAAHLVELDSGLRFDSEASAVRLHLSENGLFPPPLGGATLNEGDISASTSYTIDWWGKNRAILQSAIGEEKSAEAEHDAAKLTLAGEVTDAYFSWQDVASRLNLTRQMVDKRQLALQLTQSRLKRGIDSAIISNQIEVMLVQEQDTLKDLETQLKILHNRLAALTGNGPDWETKLEESANLHAGLFPLPQKLPLDLLAQRPDLIALNWRVEAAKSRTEVAKAEFYPNVDLNLALGLQSLDLGSWLTTKNWYASFGPAVHIPLFNVRTLRTHLSMTETEYAGATSKYNQALIVAANQVADTLTRVVSLNTREKLQHTATDHAERVQHLQKERFESGLSDRLPVLDGEIATLIQQTREFKLQADHKRAMASLFVALGGGFTSSQE